MAPSTESRSNKLDDSSLQSIISLFPYRKSEITQLHFVLKRVPTPFALITGPHGTGKSTITKQLIQQCFQPESYCWLDCAEYCSIRLIYGTILSKLFPSDRTSIGLSDTFLKEKIELNRRAEQEEQQGMPLKRTRSARKAGLDAEIVISPTKRATNVSLVESDEQREHQRQLTFFNCNHHLEFIETMNELLKESQTSKMKNKKKIEVRKFTIILDNAEYLLKFENLLAILPRLGEFSLVPVIFSVIFISTHSLEYFRQVPGLVIQPLVILFRPFTQKIISQLIVDVRPEEFDQNLYTIWVKLVLATFYPMCRNVEQLRYICETRFRKVSSMFPAETDFGVQVQQQWIKFQNDHLKPCLDSFSFKTENELVLCDELPVCAKYILIASYCASHNSVKSDRRFFLRLKDTTVRCRYVRKQAMTKMDKMPTGPKPFTLERLLHIYRSLQELNEGHEFDPMLQKEYTSHLMSQIMTFVSQKLIVKVNSVSNSFPFSSLSKYRIADCVTFDFIEGLSASVDFNLRENLEQNLIKQ